jgi:hypothetical protein
MTVVNVCNLNEVNSRKKDDDTTNLNIWQLSHFTVYIEKFLCCIFFIEFSNVSSRQKAADEKKTKTNI